MPNPVEFAGVIDMLQRFDNALSAREKAGVIYALAHHAEAAATNIANKLFVGAKDETYSSQVNPHGRNEESEAPE